MFLRLEMVGGFDTSNYIYRENRITDDTSRVVRDSQPSI
jgi:hypothetical protein